MTHPACDPSATGATCYEPDESGYDEALAGEGTPRPHYRELMALLEELDLEDLSASTVDDLDRHGVWFGPQSGGGPFVVDPVPRILTAPEWRHLEAGLIQRVRALNAFVADVYGPQAIIAAGVVPRASRNARVCSRAACGSQ